MGEAAASRRRIVVDVALAGLLVLVAVVSPAYTPLVSSLGLIVIAVALFLPLWDTVVLAILALLLSSLLALVRDGENSWLRVGNVLAGAALAIAVSAVMQARLRRVQASMSLEQQVLAAISEGVVVLDSDGVVLRANEGLRRLVPDVQVGAPLHPLLGHMLADGTDCPGGCALDGHRPETLTKDPVEGERITRNGRSLPLAYTVGPYGETELVATLRDVSARVAAQEDRQVLLENAVRAEEQAHLMQVLGGGGPHVTMTPGIDTDVWVPGANLSGSSANLTAVTTSEDGCVVLMVDSDGTGVEAMRDAWKVLYVCRAHLTAGAPLAEMVGRAADSLSEDGDHPAATIVGVVLDPITGHLQVASGGHPPPLLTRADGHAIWVEAAGRAMGEERPRSIRLSSTVLGPGDTLLVYGRGLIDGSRDPMEGSSVLCSVAVALRQAQIEGVARRIGEAVIPDDQARAAAGSLVALRLASS